MLTDALKLILETEEPPDWSRLGQHFPYEWIEQLHKPHPASPFAGRAGGVADHRFGLIQALISEVVDELDLALPDVDAPFVSKSAVAQARQRLGEAPLKWLFQTSAWAWSSQDQDAYLFKGLSLLAMDGTTLRTADSRARHSGDRSSKPQEGLADIADRPKNV